MQFETNIIGKLQHNKLEFSLFPKKKGTTPRKKTSFWLFSKAAVSAGSGALTADPRNHQAITRVPGTFTSVDLKFMLLKMMLQFDDFEDGAGLWGF